MTLRRGARLLAPMPDLHAAPVVEELVPIPNPARCCELLSGLPYRLFLDSAAPDARLGRYSFLTADPIAVVRCRGSQTECIDFLRPGSAARTTNGDALGILRALLEPHAAAPALGAPPFQGGAAGYIAYEWGRSLERVPAPRYDDLNLPDFVFGVYDWVLAWDHVQQRAWLISTGLPETSFAARSERAVERAGQVRKRLQSRNDPDDSAAIAGAARVSRWPRETAPSFPIDAGWWSSTLDVRSSFTHDAYLAAVARVREHIFAGDIFQATLAQRFEAPIDEPAWELYRRLRTQNAAPFAAYLDFPEAVVLSASPERFLRVDIHGRVETRPIKGTRPRSADPEHDSALAVALAVSAKDQAENLMIVDLMRNDLSRVCAPGTIQVTELFGLEHYATVHHLVSTVVGDLRPDVTALDLLRASFPGGSITGAPKVRAMEIIAELEPCARGVYCGSIGYWSVTGALDMNIAIRTMSTVGDRVYFGAGGGVVADSDPEQEYGETLDKARGMIEALTSRRGPAHR
jgi:para-aminobenzoate synthetase component 1